MNELTREAIIDAARQAAEKAGSALSRSEFERIAGIGQYHIYRLFPEGGWSEVKKLAGLDRRPKDNTNLTDEALIEEFHRVASLLGKSRLGPSLRITLRSRLTLSAVGLAGCKGP